MELTTEITTVYKVKGRYQSFRYFTETAAQKRLAWELIKDKFSSDIDEMDRDWLAYLHFRFLRRYFPKAAQHCLHRTRASASDSQPIPETDMPF